MLKRININYFIILFFVCNEDLMLIYFRCTQTLKLQKLQTNKSKKLNICQIRMNSRKISWKMTAIYHLKPISVSHKKAGDYTEN